LKTADNQTVGWNTGNYPCTGLQNNLRRAFVYSMPCPCIAE